MYYDTVIVKGEIYRDVAPLEILYYLRGKK